MFTPITVHIEYGSRTQARAQRRKGRHPFRRRGLRRLSKGFEDTERGLRRPSKGFEGTDIACGNPTSKPNKLPLAPCSKKKRAICLLE